MSRFPLTVPTASNGALLAHSRKVIVSLKIYHRTQSEYTSLNQDQDIFSSQVCLFMTRHTVAGTVILKKKKEEEDITHISGSQTSVCCQQATMLQYFREKY